MELRKLSGEDRELIRNLFRDVFTHEPWMDDWSDEVQLEAYISDLTGQSNSLALGFFTEGKMVALSMGQIRHGYTGTEYVVDEFCVDRAYQGRGTGKAFLGAMEAYLRETGIQQIFLQTERDAPAYGFYLHCGFQEMTGHVSFAKRIRS